MFCSERYDSFEALPAGARVGTSSPRRRAQLGALRPDLAYATIRGNVDTRLRKLSEGEFDAIILAAAGLARLGVRAGRMVPFDPAVLVPAVGQGVLAIECRLADAALAQRLNAVLADAEATICVRAERAFLATLRGGCQAPIGAHARMSGSELEFLAVIASPTGDQILRFERRLSLGESDTEARARQAEAFARQLADEAARSGGDALLGAR